MLQRIILVQELDSQGADAGCRIVEGGHSSEPSRFIGKDIGVKQQKSWATHKRGTGIDRCGKAGVAFEDCNPERDAV
jgi:hypothetical protein